MATLTDETNLTQEKNKAIEQAASILIQISQAPCQTHSTDDKVASTCQAHRKQSKPTEKDEQVTTQTISLEGDFSEEIRVEIDEWLNSEDDPQKIFNKSEVKGKFSKPVKKQLTSSDVKDYQSRLMLPRLKVEQTMLSFLDESENPPGKKGLDVSVYGPDGKVHEMKFKFWNGDRTPVLTTGWKQFVAKYGLKKHSDFLTIWMFRHTVTRKICFVIDCENFPLKKQPREDPA